MEASGLDPILHRPLKDYSPLDEIIARINEEFFGDFTDADRVMLDTLYTKMRQETFTISETKTKNSNRTLRLPDTLFDLLIVRYAELQKLRAEVGSGYNPLNLVCCRDSGQPFTCGVLHHQFHAALVKAGLPSIRFHDLRHTTATFMLQNAVPAKIVSAMLGHSSIGITMDTYSHVLTDMQEGATSKMNTLLKKLY